MKQKLFPLLLAAFSLLVITQFEAHADNGVARTANTWLLTPASWHPNPSKTYENYPFDLKENKINRSTEEQTEALNSAGKYQPLNDPSVSSPVYYQQKP